MTKEHLGLALALGVPVFVVVTKIDMCPPNILQETLQMLHKILKSPGCRKMPVLVQTVDDVVVSAMNFTSERLNIRLFIYKLIYKVPLGRNFRGAVSSQRSPKPSLVLVAPTHGGMARLSGPEWPGEIPAW